MLNLPTAPLDIALASCTLPAAMRQIDLTNSNRSFSPRGNRAARSERRARTLQVIKQFPAKFSTAGAKK
jgi:hypothetical protein